MFSPWELPWACKASPVSAFALLLRAHGSALLTRCLVQLRIHQPVVRGFGVCCYFLVLVPAEEMKSALSVNLSRPS